VQSPAGCAKEEIMRRYGVLGPTFQTSSEFWVSVTPVFQVRLDDILDRKHLPPLGSFFLLFYTSSLTDRKYLGLKDFEVYWFYTPSFIFPHAHLQEWLLYCEDAVENL
jgi:hypothetical protein